MQVYGQTKPPPHNLHLVLECTYSRSLSSIQTRGMILSSSFPLRRDMSELASTTTPSPSTPIFVLDAILWRSRFSPLRLTRTDGSALLLASQVIVIHANPSDFSTGEQGIDPRRHFRMSCKKLRLYLHTWKKKQRKKEREDQGWESKRKKKKKDGSKKKKKKAKIVDAVFFSRFVCVCVGF